MHYQARTWFQSRGRLRFNSLASVKDQVREFGQDELLHSKPHAGSGTGQGHDAGDTAIFFTPRQTPTQ